MRYIQKFFKSKENFEEFIEEKGMEAAVKEYGIDKLLMYKLLFQYEGTELYRDDFRMVDKVYNKDGKCLGEITHLLTRYYKKLGYFYGPCLNGNIILSQNSKNQQGRTYGVFDKNGNQIVPYGKYFNHCFLPNGVALMDKTYETENNAITIGYDGTVKTQPFTYIETSHLDCADNVYKVYKMEDGGITNRFTQAKNIIEISQQAETTEETEKGIE